MPARCRASGIVVTALVAGSLYGYDCPYRRLTDASIPEAIEWGQWCVVVPTSQVTRAHNLLGLRSSVRQRKNDDPVATK